MGFSFVVLCIYHYFDHLRICIYVISVVCHGVNHGAGAYQRVARISTRETRVKEGLRFGWLLVYLFFRELNRTIGTIGTWKNEFDTSLQATARLGLHPEPEGRDDARYC